MAPVWPDWAFFALWPTIQNRWQQIFYPNCPHCKAIFVKVSKSFIFLVKSFLGNFYRHLAIFIWSYWMVPICFCMVKKSLVTLKCVSYIWFKSRFKNNVGYGIVSDLDARPSCIFVKLPMTQPLFQLFVDSQLS